MNPKKKPRVTDAIIGANVRKMRRRSEIGFKELAESVDISEQMLQRHETGVSPLTVIRLFKIAETLGCNPWKLTK